VAALLIIGVIGGQRPPEEALALAERVGELVAKAGATLLCGGLGGVMEAACSGAKRAGGLTIGILPGGDKHEANPHVTIPIVTAMGTARNVIVVRTADALIAVDGSFGTLSEIAHAMELRKRVFALRSWPVPDDPVAREYWVPVTTPEEAVARAAAYAEASGRAA
jgi:hypothetical protein